MNFIASETVYKEILIIVLIKGMHFYYTDWCIAILSLHVFRYFKFMEVCLFIRDKKFQLCPFISYPWQTENAISSSIFFKLHDCGFFAHADPIRKRPLD
jgi:hypothetical protein